MDALCTMKSDRQEIQQCWVSELLAKKVFGTPNDRKIKATRPIVEKINALEPEISALTDQGLKRQNRRAAQARAH